MHIAASADVLVQNLRSGVAAQAEVGDTTVVRAYVLSLVYVSAPGFGFTGHVPAIPSATR